MTPKQGEDAAAAAARRDAGPRDVVQRIASQMKECPDERFALVGYSQGGGVISRAAQLLTPEQINKIDAVVTYGAKGTFPEVLQKKWLNNCAPGDLCGGLPGDEGHLSYNNKGTVWHDRSAKYLADAFAGKSQGQVFAKTSKQ
jgi:pimeloyl-ACP methyl ester carboxylesterase